MSVEKTDYRNFMGKTITHEQHGCGEVVEKTGDMLRVAFKDGTKKTVHIKSVTIMSNAPKAKIDYTKFIAHAPESIKKMFTALSDEDKKKYAEVAEFTPEHKSFSFTTKMSNGLTQHAFWKFANTVDISDDKLKLGYIEKHGENYFASKQAREDLRMKKGADNEAPEDVGITPARFQAFVKNMPAGDYKNLGSSSAAHFQAFISLGGNFSGKVEQTMINGQPQYKKLPAEMDNLHLYRDESNIDRSLVCGYLGLAGADKNGKSWVLSAVKDKDEKPGYDHYTMDNGYAAEDTMHPDHGIALENDLLPLVTLAEKPIVRYKNGAGETVDKDGNPL